MWQMYLNYHQRMRYWWGPSLSMSPARRLAHFMPPCHCVSSVLQWIQWKQCQRCKQCIQCQRWKQCKQWHQTQRLSSLISVSILSSESSASSLGSSATSISGVIFLNEWRVGANNYNKQKPSGVEFALHEMEVEGKKVAHFLFLISSTRSSYIHPDLLVTHQHKIFQVNNFETSLNQF